MNLFQKKEAREKALKEEAEIRKQKTLEKRIQREIKKTINTNQVSFFLKKQSEKNSFVKDAIAFIESNNAALSQGTLPIQYQPISSSPIMTTHSNQRPEQSSNFIVDICYNGEPRKLALIANLLPA